MAGQQLVAVSTTNTPEGRAAVCTVDVEVQEHAPTSHVTSTLTLHACTPHPTL